MGSPLVEQFRAGAVPVELRLLAAQGALPLGPSDLIELLAHLTTDHEESVRTASVQALSVFPSDDLLPILSDRATHPSVLAWAIEFRTDSDELRTAALQNKSVPSDALERVAGVLPEGLAELVVINQDRLLKSVSLLVALEANPDLNPDQRRRLREFREEFFKEPPAPAPSAPPDPEPPAALEPPVDAPATLAEAAAVYLDESERNDTAKVSALQRLYSMSPADKLLTALKGTREERAILIRDPNRIVWAAVLSSPKLTGSEVESFASMKNISDQALQKIGSQREWTRHRGVAVALVRNPRTPIGIALTLIPLLQGPDLKSISMDRNAPEAIRRAAQRFVRKQ